jgi:hypothetical protein
MGLCSERGNDTHHLSAFLQLELSHMTLPTLRQDGISSNVHSRGRESGCCNSLCLNLLADFFAGREGQHCQNTFSKA